MGNFDYIKVNYNLPDKPSWDNENELFQTKNLDPTLLSRIYFIEIDGRLKTEFDSIKDYTGTISFYKGLGDVNDLRSYRWLEYKGEFKKGHLIKVEKVYSGLARIWWKKQRNETYNLS